jgi:hypothetical protein
MLLFKNLLKKQKCIPDRKFKVSIHTSPRTHFLVKFRDLQGQFHIKETFNGEWENEISLKDVESISIDTFVTNQRGYQKITCQIEVDELGACNRKYISLTESYTAYQEMKEWKWVKHNFALPSFHPEELQLLSA